MSTAVGIDLVHSFVLATASEVDSPCPSDMNSPKSWTGFAPIDRITWE